MNQPNDEDLLRLCLEGELPEELRKLADQPEGGRVRAALELCTLLGELPLEQPPAGVRRSARELGREPSALRVLLAKLWTPPSEALPAFRGAATAPEVHRAGPFELDVTRTAGGDLVGELIAVEDGVEQPTAGRCSLFGEDVRTTELGADGGFHIADVAPGEQRLVLDLEDGTVIVCELSL